MQTVEELSYRYNKGKSKIKIKTFSASDMRANPKPIYKQAREDGGVIIERKNTNGVVEERYVLHYLGDGE